jgi:hypothetical protein
MDVQQPSLLSKDLWARQVTNFICAIEVALQKLRASDALPEQEVELNRELYFMLLEAIQGLDPDGSQYHVAPMPECCSLPDPDDLTRTVREGKRPDFQWTYRDTHIGCLEPRRMVKSFVVECKRLGSPKPKHWILNENYIKHGVCRFREVEHSYARSFESGAMIGYIQSMEPYQILKEVNDTAKAKRISQLILTPAGWKPDDINTLLNSTIPGFSISPISLLG